MGARSCRFIPTVEHGPFQLPHTVRLARPQAGFAVSCQAFASDRGLITLVAWASISQLGTCPWANMGKCWLDLSAGGLHRGRGGVCESRLGVDLGRETSLSLTLPSLKRDETKNISFSELL